jgi:biopolymer transport protein ExbD
VAVALAGARAGGRFILGQTHDINVTPFVDVMLVLLIIFMVAAPMATSAIKLDLPPTPLTPNNLPAPVYVSITRDGRLFVSGPLGDEAATLGGLGGRLTAAFRGSPTDRDEVFIRADQHVSYGVFMSVVNRLQDDGYYKVALVSEAVRP